MVAAIDASTPLDVIASFSQGLLVALEFLGGTVLLFLFAWIAARLLGVRHRSWVTLLVAAIGGQIVGTVFVVAITNGEVTEMNRFLSVVFVLIGMMLATVVIDLVADQRTSRHHALRLPHPVRGARTAWRRTRRYLHVLRIASRRGLGPYVGLRGEPEAASVAASSVRQAMEEAGGVFVKLGQLLAGRADLLPAEARREFARLQEQAAPTDAAGVREVIETDLGVPLEEAFERFDLTPVAAASIGQAHAARLRSGVEVIVKVQRPGIAAAMEDDLAVLQWLARSAERRTEWGRTYGAVDLAEEFANGLREELDFRIEARNVREGALALAGEPNVTVPRVYEELSTRRLLVLERLGGIPVSDLSEDRSPPDDVRKLGDALLRAVVIPMMTGERFHADPHPGNVRILPHGAIALLDFGATGRLDTYEQTSVTEILLAIRGHDPSLLLDGVREVATFRHDVDERQLEHALARFLARNVTPGASPDASTLTELLRLFLVFGITLPAGTTTMFRALVTLQGTLESLCPHYPIIDAAEEVAGAGLTKREPPTLAAAEKEVLTAIPVLRRVPRHLDRVATQLENGDLRFQTRLFADARDVRVVTRLVSQVVLVISAAIAAGLSIGLLSLTGGPAVSAGLTFHHTLGYITLTLALILLLRAVMTALRDQP